MIPIKTPGEIKTMAEGGRRLGRIKKALEEKIGEEVRASDMEELAVDLIEKEDGKASFKMVPGYSYVTCVNVNEGLVHGIPTSNVVFKKGDLVSIDVGMFYKGFHTDTSFSVGVAPGAEVQRFLEVGKKALEKAVDAARSGKHIYDISKAIEGTVMGAGYSPIRALVGHGVGRELHEEPQIPCFVPGKIEDSAEIKPGTVLDIEVMYALGVPDVVQMSDGWTIAMCDGKISGLFEETVAVLASGPQIITQ